MIESTETEAVLSRFPFAFTSSLVQQLIQNGHMNMLVT